MRVFDQFSPMRIGFPRSRIPIATLDGSVDRILGMDWSKKEGWTYKLYGDDAKKPGTFAYTCLLARRLVERGVRFVQVYHNNWDHHSNVGDRLPSQGKDVDQATDALINDLKARGMFDNTPIIWGGEFGRTIYRQGGLTKDNCGRDHHPQCRALSVAAANRNPIRQAMLPRIL